MSSYRELPDEVVSEIAGSLERKDLLVWIRSSRQAYLCGRATLYDTIDMSPYNESQVKRLAHILAFRPDLAYMVRDLTLPDYALCVA